MKPHSSTEIGFWEVSASSGDLYWSDEVYRIHGLEPGTEIDVDAAISAYHPDDRMCVREHLRLAFEEKQNYHFVLRLMRSDGKQRYVFSTGIVRRNQDGEVQALIGTFEDITERKRTEDALVVSEKNFRNVVEQAGDAMFVIEPSNGRFVDVNIQACCSLGYSRDQLLALCVPDIDVEFPIETFEAQMSSLERDTPLTFESTHLRKDGSVFPVEIRVGLVELQDGIRLLAMVRDITERKRAEKQLRDAHEELEHKILERTAELEKARDEAEAANIAKSHLITTMSHELRTPLTSIVGSLRLLMSDHTEIDAATRENLIEMAWRNSDRLANLVNDIVVIERLEAGVIKPQMQQVDLKMLVQESVALEQGYAMEKNITLVVAEMAADVHVLGENKRLLQVMANLLSNACKFSPTGETVTISLTQNKNTAKVSVSDNGSGIPDGLRGNIFGKYVRGENTDTRNTGGAGLGLSISKSIVEMHNGKIGFEANDGGGTTFYFTLPRA